MKKPNLLIFIFTLMLPFTLFAQKGATTEQRIDALFASFHNEMPGAAVAVSLDGKLIYNKAFGMANLEHTVPNTTATIFEAGSVSKQFVAAGVLMLAKEGRLSLGDDVRKYVPELPVYEAAITIDMLLSHTSGLKEWGAIYSLTGWPRTTRVYTQELGYDIIFRQKSLNFLPGSQYSYSNSNYMMLTLIVERVSGLSLAQFTAERFFGPMGMSQTSWRDNHRVIVPGRATAYDKRDGKFLLNMPFEDLHGPGGLLTTTHDLLIWNRLLEGEEMFGSEYAINRVAERKLNDGKGCGYAAGLTIGKYNGYDEIAHSGSTAGYRAWLAWYPQKRLSVVLLSNYAQFQAVQIGRAIAAIFVGEEPTSPAQSVAKADDNVDDKTPSPKREYKSLAEYEGEYFSEEAGSTTFIIKLTCDKLEVRRKAGESFSLTNLSGDKFTSDGNGDYLFTRDRRGKVNGFKVSVMRASDIPFYIL
ncbi:MAG: serine hydrolase domain-containing protein [Bacteroidales bacterium]